MLFNLPIFYNRVLFLKKSLSAKSYDYKLN